MMELQVENMEIKICLGTNHLNNIPTAQGISIRNNKVDQIKLKSFYIAKEIIRWFYRKSA